MLTEDEEYDFSKKMLGTIRNGGRLITESDGQANVEGGQSNNMQDNQSGTQQQPQQQNQGQPASQAEDLDSEQLAQEQKKFFDTVSPKVQFKSFKIYRKERNVVMSGTFQDMGGMEFTMSLKEADGLTIGVDNLTLNQDSIDVLNKLHGYYKNWSTEWSTAINTEYKYNEGKAQSDR
jgi:hypothetical protein